MARKVLHGSVFGKMLLCSFGHKISIVAVCTVVAVCLHAPLALAQHAGHAGGFGGGGFGGGGHFGGGGGRSSSSAAHSGGGSHASAPHGSATPAPAPPRATSGFRSSTNPRSSNLLPLTTFGTGNFRPVPPRPRPAPPVSIIYIPVYYGSPFFYGGFNSFWGCDPFWGWGPGCYSPFGFGYGGWGYNGWGYGGFGGYGNWNGYSSPSSNNQGAAQTYTVPAYPTEQRRNMVELYFKDGTTYDVTDYWLVDGQLRFTTIEESRDKVAVVQHALPFDNLDLQQTIDVNTQRGFKFQLRNQPVEQYLREHPDAHPKVDPDRENNQ